MLYFLSWIFFSGVAGAIADNKGRSSFGFFLLSIILSPIVGITCALVAQKIEPPVQRYICPDCKETILKDALVCKHCGLRFDTESDESLKDSASFENHVSADKMDQLYVKYKGQPRTDEFLNCKNCGLTGRMILTSKNKDGGSNLDLDGLICPKCDSITSRATGEPLRKSETVIPLASKHKVALMSVLGSFVALGLIALTIRSCDTTVEAKKSYNSPVVSSPSNEFATNENDNKKVNLPQEKLNEKIIPEINCNIIDDYQIGMTIKSFKEFYPNKFPSPTCYLTPSTGEKDVSCYGQMLMNNLLVYVTFHFADGKLFSIDGNFDPINFLAIRTYFVDKFGNPDTYEKKCGDLRNDREYWRMNKEFNASDEEIEHKIEQYENDIKLSGGCETMVWNNYGNSTFIVLSQLLGGALGGPGNNNRFSFIPSPKNSSACFSNVSSATHVQRAQKAIKDYAKSKGITVGQLEQRTGMNHDDLVEEIENIIDDAEEMDRSGINYGNLNAQISTLLEKNFKPANANLQPDRVMVKTDGNR